MTDSTPTPTPESDMFKLHNIVVTCPCGNELEMQPPQLGRMMLTCTCGLTHYLHFDAWYGVLYHHMQKVIEPPFKLGNVVDFKFEFHNK